MPDQPLPLVPETPAPVVEELPDHSRLLSILAGLVTLVVLGSLAFFWVAAADEPRPDGPAATPATPVASTPATTSTDASSRDEALAVLLAERAAAVLRKDSAGFLASVDPLAPDFAAAQRRLARRLEQVPFAAWSYRLVGDGPGLAEDRAAGLPDGSSIVRVRVTYRLDGTATDTDREQYLTVVPRGGRWLFAGDNDAMPSGFETQRDVWDLGDVQVVRGERAVVVGDVRSGRRPAMRRLAREADLAVTDVDRIWEQEWSRRPVILLPASQQDMATLIGSDGEGLAQIAAVTTGAFEEGVSRGDRIVVNPATFDTLGTLGRRVVLTHEMTHVATRATGVVPVPIWLSEGFADYVAYEATSVPTAIVAGDVLEDVRDGKGPEQLPSSTEFDAGTGDIAAAYEGAWLAARMIADRYGERRLVAFYVAMNDSTGPGWPEETEDLLGVSPRRLERRWLSYLEEVAAQ